MILRPETDAELLELIAEVVADGSIQLDTAAMLAFLLARKDLLQCPVKQDLVFELRSDAANTIGTGRISRMVREACAAGYMTRATRPVPRIRRRPLYSFVVGSKASVAAIKTNAVENG